MKAAVFYDLENCLEPELGLGKIHQKLTQAFPEVSLAVQRAYANFSKGYAHHVDDLHRYGITPVQVFGAKPNAVDFELALDALRLTLEDTLIQMVILVSNDGDYLPLLRHLRELQIETLCVLTKKNAHDMLRSNASRVLDLHVSKAKTAPQAKTVQTVSIQKKPEAELKQPEAKHWPAFRKLKNASDPTVFSSILINYLKIIDKNKYFAEAFKNDGLLLPALNAVIKKSNPDFTHTSYGFKNFSALLFESLENSDWGLFKDANLNQGHRLCRRKQVATGYLDYRPVAHPPLKASQATGKPSSQALPIAERA